MARQRHNAAFITGSILGGVGGAAVALWTAPRSGPELRALLAKRLGGSSAAPASATSGTRTGMTASDAETGAHASAAPSSVSRAWNATTTSGASVVKASQASLAQVSRVTKSSLDSLASTALKGRDSGNETSSGETRSFGGRALSFVENATAPIVGVKLGQSARNADARATDTGSSGSGTPATAASPAPVAPGAPVAPAASGRVVERAAPAEPAEAPVVSATPVTRQGVVSSSAAPAAPVDSAAPQSTGDLDDSGIGHAASTEELVTPVIPDESRGITQETGSSSFTDFPEFEADKRPT
ncbi:MAG: hypothetical protein AVDCRST_MAG87-760 [uncultured Thermomicrobiales bacterium]|uniref:Uncharacterized protein n=1 Tax=uncultured Thermomicrobiales bacterium TaxID=1645740 RepID=A0A6J4UHE8_9BACT|nr:MAG: hypothetical protein AVDCRST_MAG87-760 [uncultured Thermomicrobiales bacterium]